MPPALLHREQRTSAEEGGNPKEKTSTDKLNQNSATCPEYRSRPEGAEVRMMVAYGGEIGVGIEMEVLEEALKDPGTEAIG